MTAALHNSVQQSAIRQVWVPSTRFNSQFAPQHRFHFVPDPQKCGSFRQSRNPSCGPTPPTFIHRTMTLRNAALLALIGTILMTALLLWTFVSNFLNVLRGLVPAVTLFSSVIYAFGAFSVMVFFFVFHRTQ